MGALEAWKRDIDKWSHFPCPRRTPSTPFHTITSAKRSRSASHRSRNGATGLKSAFGAAEVKSPAMRLAQTVRWIVTLVTTAVGLAGMARLAAHVAGDTATRISLSRVTWSFLTYWAVLASVTVLVYLPWMSGMVHRFRMFFTSDYDNSDRAGLALILGSVTRWRRRVVTARTGALLVGVAALSSMLWGTTPAGIWDTIRDPSRQHGEMFPHLGLVLPAMLWWFVLSVGIFWISLLALGLGLPTLPAAFTYRVRSRRLGFAAAIGARQGLTILADVIQLTPIALLAYAGLRANPSLRQLLEKVLPDPIRHAAGAGVQAIAWHPIESAVVLGSLPIVALVLIYRLCRRWTAIDARDWSIATDTPPVLYLRTWNADRIHLTTDGLRRGLLEHLDVPRRMSLAEVIGTSLEFQAPVIATAEPGGSRLVGVGSMWSTNGEWRSNVEARAATALCVVMTADTVADDTGFSWEVETIGGGRVTDRIVLVLPPGISAKESQKPGGFLHKISQYPAFSGLDTLDLTDETLVLVRDAGEKWFPFCSSIRTDLAYYLCIMDAVDRRRDDWTLMAVQAVGGDRSRIDTELAEVSEERFAQEASTDGPLAVHTLRLFHRLATSSMSRKLAKSKLGRKFLKGSSR